MFRPPDKVGSVRATALGMYPAGATGSLPFGFFLEVVPTGPLATCPRGPILACAGLGTSSGMETKDLVSVGEGWSAIAIDKENGGGAEMGAVVMSMERRSW
jgi:hypothetical protein